MADVNITRQKQRPAGFNCPKCAFFIEVSIESLLRASSEKCPKCQTEFIMNREDSEVALQFIQNLKVASDNLNATK
jgi:uncharacterized paraquat-inducible protein A